MPPVLAKYGDEIHSIFYCSKYTALPWLRAILENTCICWDAWPYAVMALGKQEKIVAVTASENMEVGPYADQGQIYLF